MKKQNAKNKAEHPDKEDLIYFNREHAKVYGINEAILLNHFIFWIKKNAAEGRNCIDGRTWTFNSRSKMLKLLDFFTEQNLKTAINNLEKHGVIIKSNFNQKKYDKTNWYALADESAFGIKALVNTNQSIGVNQPAHWLNLTNPLVNTNQPIPDNIPYKEKDKEQVMAKPDQTEFFLKEDQVKPGEKNYVDKEEEEIEKYLRDNNIN
jgi:hypothetical protein